MDLRAWLSALLLACTMTTYWLPDGRLIVCQTCCDGPTCTVTCL